VHLAAKIARAFSARLVLLAEAGSEAIAQAVGADEPGMIVIGDAPQRGLRRFFSSHRVDHILHDTRIPLLVVHD
jgi:nucleotide-binding universal stress UspA family protein